MNHPFYTFGPNQATPPDAYLSTGTVVTLQEKSWGWAQVQLPDGRTGVMARNALRPATVADLVPSSTPWSLMAAAVPRRRGLVAELCDAARGDSGVADGTSRSGQLCRGGGIGFGASAAVRGVTPGSSFARDEAADAYGGPPPVPDARLIVQYLRDERFRHLGAQPAVPHARVGDENV